MNELALLQTIKDFLHGPTSGHIPGDWFERVEDGVLARVLPHAPDGLQALLASTLGVDRALRFVGDLERRVDLELEASAGDMPAPDSALPAVILLPGFMGVHLVDDDLSRAWLDPAAAMRGDLAARAALTVPGAAPAAPGERLAPDGLVRLIYADLIQSLRAAGHAVHPFPFDFRRSLTATEPLLHDFVTAILEGSPDTKIVVVGHSMGALLACLLADTLPDFADRVEQTILLGGSLGGTFDSVESVTGTHWILPRLASLSPRDKEADFQACLATWPGVFDLLPDPAAFPGSGCERAFDAASWPAPAVPDQQLLTAAWNLKARIRQSKLFRSGKTVTQLLATGYPTVGSLVQDENGKITAGPRTFQGDGVVAASSALVPGVVGYRTAFPHILAPVEPAAIQAVLALIQTGACALEPIALCDVTTECSPDGTPAAQMARGLLESGPAAIKDGCLTFPAAAWLLSPYC